MTELEKAARMALEALQYLVEHDSYGTEYDGRIIHICPSCSKQDGAHSQNCDFVKGRQVITALTQALAPTERKGEPVAYFVTWPGDPVGMRRFYGADEWEASRKTVEYFGGVSRPLIFGDTSPQVPEGFALVPVEPTKEMNVAGFNAHRATGLTGEIWRAMLTAAPQAPACVWITAADRVPLEADGEVFVRFADGSIGTAWATYWHGASNDFAQWTFPDPDEHRTVSHWMKPPAVDAARKGEKS